jgi:hypothetical protein
MHKVTAKSPYPIPNLTTDTRVNTVCRVQRTMTKDMHILIMTVLPHITFEFHSTTQQKVCTYRSTREVRRGKVTKHHQVQTTVRQGVTLQETLEMVEENILLAVKCVTGK